MRNLTESQLAELQGAQAKEGEIPPLVASWIANHAAQRDMAHRYAAAPTFEMAEMARVHFDSLAVAGRGLEQLAAEGWTAIFDSKSYLYNLAADRTNSSGLLELFERSIGAMRERRAELGHTNAMVDYALQKGMMTRFEAALASEIGNGQAADSLRRLTLPNADSLARFDPVKLRERLFLDYAPIGIGRSPYSSARPIPELKVWPRGIIYRVLVGTFASRQAVSVFRGAWPLALAKGEDGKYRYYAGGLATDVEIEQEVARLRKAGFRAPEAAVWMDGVLVEDGSTYRIDLAGEIPAELRELASSGEIVRGEGGAFIVTGLEAAVAKKLRSALEIFPDLEARLSK